MGKKNAKKKYKLTQKDFDQIHQLLNLGLKKKLVADATGWSYSLVLKVSRLKSYQEYLDKQQEALKRNQNKAKTDSTLDGGFDVQITDYNPYERIESLLEEINSNIAKLLEWQKFEADLIDEAFENNTPPEVKRSFKERFKL